MSKGPFVVPIMAVKGYTWDNFSLFQGNLSMSQLTLSFFGAFTARLDDKPLVNFRSAKVQGLLIYLALTRQQAHERDLLAILFWPDEPESVANHNLRQSLYRLRELLGEPTASKEPLPQAQGRPYLLITRATVQFNGASHTKLDVAAFLTHLETHQLEQAVALYQGDLLPGFTCDSLPFDEWLRQEREQLHRLALDALFDLTTQALARTDYQSAQRLARQQLTLAPWREEAHRQLIQTLFLMGERSAALAQVESCRAVLREELGVAPSAETETLAARIRDAQPAQAVRADATSEVGRQRLTIPFVGRKHEYEALVQAYRRAKRDGLQVVTIGGNAGIGKTRLTQQFLAWAATQGTDVLAGHSFETSGGLSYQPITHLLRQHLERENAPEDLLADLWLAQLTRLLPELRERYPDLPEPTQEEATAKQHLFEAVTRLVQALAERQPLVLLIDDWHWADSASLDMLHYASQRWTEEKAPILVLLTLRQEALSESPALQSWLHQLRRTVSVAQIKLGELSQTETAQLVQVLLTPVAENDHVTPADIAMADIATRSALPKFSQWLFKETDGQPLLLAETLKALVADGLVQPNEAGSAWRLSQPKLDEQALHGRVLHGVREIIQGWLVRITIDASALLTAASVLAQAASFDNLCRVSGLDEMQAMTALEELLNRQLLLETDEMQTLTHHPIYTFSHQKVREVVYSEARTARRRMLHRRAFEALQTAATPAADLAYHALHAGLLAETIRYSLMAGNDAMAIFATRVAIIHFETVWQIAEQKGWPEEVSGADRQTLYTALGRAYELSEAWPKSQAIYAAMIAHAQTMGATAMECLGLNHLATVYLNGLNDQSQALQILEQAQRVAEQSGDRRGLAETEWNLSLAAIQAQNGKVALQHSERALAIAHELVHPHLLARCLTSIAQAYLFLRQWEKALAYVLETHQMFLAAGDLVMAANSQRGIGFLQIFSGHPVESVDTLQQTFVFSQRIENLMGEADCAWILARAYLEVGNYGAAIKLGQQAVAQTRTVGHPLLHTVARSAWGIVQRTVMDWEAAQKTLLALFEQSPAEGGIGWTDQAPELCALYASVGDWEQAYAYARQITHPMHADEPLLPFNLTGWYETEAFLRGGDGDLARVEVERLAGIVGNNKRYRLPLLRSQAVLAQWDGDVAQAITHLQAALALAQEIGLPGEEWPILGALAGLYAGQGEEVQAQEAYKVAGKIIRSLAETIDEEDLRAGVLAADPVRSVLKLGERG